MTTALVTMDVARATLLERCVTWWCCPTCRYPPYRLPFKCDNPACVDNAWHSPEWRAVLVERAREHEKSRAEAVARDSERRRLRKSGLTVAF